MGGGWWQELLPAGDPLPFGLHDAPFAYAVAFLFVVAMTRANVTYWLGRGAVATGRRTRLARHLDSAPMKRAEALVARWGVLAVSLCFLTVGIQTAVNASAGATRMPLRRYLPAVVIGAALWACVYATIGMAAFWSLTRLLAASPWAAVVLVLGAALVSWRLRRRRRSPGAELPCPAPERDASTR